MGRYLHFPRTGPILSIAAILLAAPSVYSHASAAEGGNPLEQLSGEWKGGGTMTPMGGDPEAVSCKVSYEEKDGGVLQNLRCAGPETTIKTNTQMAYSDGKVSGSWTESTFDRQGGINGTAKGNLVHARISGDRFSGRMSINVSGDSHTINILQLDKGSGTYRPVASIAFGR